MIENLEQAYTTRNDIIDVILKKEVNLGWLKYPDNFEQMLMNVKGAGELKATVAKKKILVKR